MSNENNETKKKKAPQEKISEAFVFDVEPEIVKGTTDTFYTIKAKQDNEQNKRLLVKEIKKYNIFTQYNLSFEDCVFECELLFNDENFKKRFRFEKCTFKEQVHFEYITFNDIVYFLNSTFEKEVDFSRSSFKERAFFSESIFEQKANFAEVIFDNNAYFDEVNFKKEAFFKQAEFYKNAHFYGTGFEEFPNFIQVIFNENVNFINTKSNIKFEKAIEQIETLYIERKTKYDNQSEEDREGKEEPKKYKIANEFRDSFRTIKSALIKDNNMLDASNYHRIELYCKELELEYKRKEKVENPTCWNTFMCLLGQGEKEKIRTLEFRDIIDEIQLYCYRLTSDHHTNLLLILNHIIFLIALFGVVSLVLTLCITDSNLENIIAKMNKAGTKATLAASLIFLGITLYVIFTCCKPSISKLIYLASILLLSAIFIFSPAFMLVIVSICSIVLLFLIFFACIVTFQCTTKDCFEIKNYIFMCSYPIVAFMLFSSPSSILPILGKLIENKSPETRCCIDELDIFEVYFDTAFSTPETLNLIYMLFLFLLLWSLQKTARKNTIVPN